MRMNRYIARAFTFSVALVAGSIFGARVAPPLFPFYLPSFFGDGGPSGFNPQLEAEAPSPDGELIVRVYRQRNPHYSGTFGAEMHARIYDRSGRLLADQMIGSDGSWTELENSYKQIEFDRDTIRISHLWGRTYVIQRSTLRP
jgi:hypothetical protein